MREFTASATAFVLAWGTDTIDKMRQTSAEEGVPQAQTTASSPDPVLPPRGGFYLEYCLCLKVNCQYIS